MKFATLRDSKCLDGRPLLVNQDNKLGADISDLAPSLREAIEKWPSIESELKIRYQKLNAGEMPAAFPISIKELHSPLPRAFQWADGSAFIHHIKLVRKARNAPLPETLLTVPLMYQGGSDTFLGPTENIPLIDEKFGLDFESEIAVVTNYVPMGTTAELALNHILLVMLVNDVSLRGLIPEELAQGFGFFQSKPSTAFGPFAITPDELGTAWKNGRVHLPMITDYNGVRFGFPDAGEMQFHFGQLIAHAARTRNLGAGTIIGSGTVSNENPKVGSSCLVEKRMIEKIETGESTTPFMKAGDRVRIEMLSENKNSLFGAIDQEVVKI